jgi:hypothetical protein
MLLTEKRPFSLLYSHHSNFSQGTTNSRCRQGLVDNVGKWFGELSCIGDLARNDKMLSMVYIGRRKLGRTTP